MARPAWAEIDLAAVAHNVGVMATVAHPAAVSAVVKADGYGHGAVPVARAALAAGAAWLGVAIAEEGVTLRDSGIDAPVLVLAEPPAGDMDLVAAFGLRPTVYTAAGIDAAAKAAAAAGHAPLPVHLKVDTGMHRVGARPADAVGLAQHVARRPELTLEALWTHCAVADEPGDPFTAHQLDVFTAIVDELAAVGLRPPLLHAANSAGAIAHPASRLDMVRAGIAVYGIAPSAAVGGDLGLRPALRLVSRVAFVKEVAAGERISYGLRHTVERETVIATVPVGYADGVRRRLSQVGAEVLIGGRRCPMVGVITMDQLMVDCGPGASVVPGDEVVLIGAQGDQWITADEWAERLDTIGYEIVCGIGPRVPRRYR